MKGPSKKPPKGEKKHELFLKNWGVMTGSYVYQVHMLTVQYLFARELYPVIDKYTVNRTFVTGDLDANTIFRNSVDPIVKELELLNGVGGWILKRFADLNKFNHSELLVPKPLMGFHGPSNWKRLPMNEAEERLYIPDLLLAFLNYAADNLLQESESYLAAAKWTKGFPFHPEKLPSDKDQQNAVLISETARSFTNAVAKIEFFRMQERN